ncbi:hypothetical protein ACYATP_08400 [Lactobacillaceae bacterium Melli_B4]
MKTYRTSYKVNLGLGSFFLILSVINLILDQSTRGWVITLIFCGASIIRFVLAFKHRRIER